MPKLRTTDGPERFFLGVDPGGSGGGLALINACGVAIWTAKMPETPGDLWDWFQRLLPATTFGMVEFVHSMPRQGVASSFKFGDNYGQLKMALTATGVPWENPSPQKWQKGLNVRGRKKGETDTAWKNHLRAVAQRLFPKTAITKATADALLIAEYCRRSRLGLLT